MSKLNMAHFSSVLLILLFQTSLLSAQHGHECSKDRPCGIHQNCYVGYCFCDPGYIRTSRNCFPGFKRFALLHGVVHVIKLYAMELCMVWLGFQQFYHEEQTKAKWNSKHYKHLHK